MTMMMLSQADRDVTYHTTAQLSHTAARSVMYTFLNSKREVNDGDLTAYDAMSLCWSGRELTQDDTITSGDVIDRGLIKGGWGKQTRPPLLQYIQINGTRPTRLSSCPNDDVKMGERGNIDSVSVESGIHRYEVKVPVLDSGSQRLETVTMVYGAKTGVIEN